MSLIVEWNGKKYDVDPSGFNQRELDLIEQRTGMDWKTLLTGAVDCQPNAVRALFWLTDQREDRDLKYSDYDGPPLSLWLSHLGEIKAIADALGKVVTAQLGTDGSDDSPSTVDTPPGSTTP